MSSSIHQPQASAPNTWWFLLGHEPLISLAELWALLSPKNYQYAAPWFKCEAALEPAKFIARLGGTVKICRELGTNLSAKALLDTIDAELKNIEGKVEFGISSYEEKYELIGEWGKIIKTRLKAGGRSVRFVFNSEPILSSASVTKNKLVDHGREFIVRRKSPANSSEALYDLALTQAVQPFEEFSARDYGRPGRDDVSGMIPPKLALMMLNLASAKTSAVVADPFCGSGTILTEALLRGYNNLIGSDQAEKAITDTEKNITWFKNKYPALAQNTVKLHAVPVEKISTILPAGSVAAIVTEPYMGPPLRGREKPDQLKNSCAALANLYISAFSEFSKILRPNGTVIFVIPRFTISGINYTVSDRIIPKLKALGFNKKRLLGEEFTPTSYILYQRPRQYLGREIWKFTLIK